MSPDQRNLDSKSSPVTACTDCGADLGGNAMRCPACVESALIAIRERQPGQTIKPSDVAAIRARMG